jgi:hypothetical protein
MTSPSPLDGVPPRRFVPRTGQGLAGRVPHEGISPEDRRGEAVEYVGLVPHGYRITHLDGLSVHLLEPKDVRRPASGASDRAQGAVGERRHLRQGSTGSAINPRQSSDLTSGRRLTCRRSSR